uniref:Uncharacterized protein n=1 Tax=Arundo donax TaxID=35708 RepID=A0A0A8Z081_ARUDO
MIMNEIQIQNLRRKHQLLKKTKTSLKITMLPLF